MESLRTPFQEAGGKQLALAVFSLFSVYWTVSAIYNIFFSPVSHIPGPFFAKFSDLPSWYHTVTRNRHLYIWRCHHDYGPRVRIAPNNILFESHQAFRDIYGARSNVRRSDSYEVWQRNESDVNTITTCDLALHHKKRRILNAVFTEKSTRAASPFINKHVDRWGDLLADTDTQKGDWSSPKNMAGETDRLVFDILCDLCFGGSLDTKEPEESTFKHIPDAIHEYLSFMYPFARSPLLRPLLWLKPRGLNYLFELLTPKSVKSYYAFVEKSVDERMNVEKNAASANEKGEMREDMLHFLLQAKDPITGQPAYSRQELLAEASLLVIAGSDTTAISLSGFFFYIVRNQDAYERLVTEIRETFESLDEIAVGAKLSSCLYLAACIDEAMRLVPAGAGEPPRTILKGGQEIDGERFPAGITVGATWWASGRSDDYGDPDVFRPDRWVVDENKGVTEQDVKKITAIFRPFSIGWGNCVGQNLARLELLTSVARTLYRFDIRSEPGSTVGEGHKDLGWGRQDPRHFQLYDVYVASRDGPMIQFRKR